jgi:hypothetical protein
MTAKWGCCAILVVCFALMIGCRTPQPNLKPEKEPEKLVAPPPDGKYDSSNYPAQAFDKPVDPGKALLDAKNTPGMPQRGSMMPTGGAGAR